MRKFLNKLFLICGLMVLLSTQELMAQCAMCRGAVESSVSGGDTSMAANLNIGIMYLFFTPYILIGVIAFIWYRASKKYVKKV